MNVPDETLMAYVDGELDAAAAALVEQAMREDPQVAARVAAQRALREQLRQAFAPVLDEPVPERLRAAADAQAAVPAPVASLQTAREARAGRRRWRWPEFTALAASLALGALLAPWLWPEPPPAPIEMAGEGLIAGGALAAALDTRLSSDRLSSDGGGSNAIDIGFSFRDREGRYCRTFTMAEPSGIAGLACRGADAWRVTATGDVAAAGGELRLASSALPASILAEVDARLEGEPLDAAGEREARRAGWR